MLTELSAHASHSELNYTIHFWRTKSGMEVDFVLGAGEIAVEVKGSSRVDDRCPELTIIFKLIYLLTLLDPFC